MKSILIFAFLAVLALLCAGQTNTPTTLTPTVLAPPSPVGARLSALAVAVPTNKPATYSFGVEITFAANATEVVGATVYAGTNSTKLDRSFKFAKSGNVVSGTITNIPSLPCYMVAVGRNAAGIESAPTAVLEFSGYDLALYNYRQTVTNTSLSTTNWRAAGPVEPINVITNPPGTGWFVQQRLSQVRSNYARQRFLP